MTEAMTETHTELALFEALALDRRADEYDTVRYFNAQGQLHRVYGPAVEYADGEKVWCQNGQLHRLDGPAVEWTGGSCAWFIDGNEFTEAEWQQAVASMEHV
jgi:beta-glucanase (GH16 family)